MRYHEFCIHYISTGFNDQWGQTRSHSWDSDMVGCSFPFPEINVIFFFFWETQKYKSSQRHLCVILKFSFLLVFFSDIIQDSNSYQSDHKFQSRNAYLQTTMHFLFNAKLYASSIFFIRSLLFLTPCAFLTFYTNQL